jgi:hypothetical protein
VYLGVRASTGPKPLHVCSVGPVSTRHAVVFVFLGFAKITISPLSRGVRSRAGSKQGVCPAPMSSHTIPAHHPGHKYHSTGSPHPDTRGWGQTATPGASLHTAKTGNEAHRCGDSRLHTFSIHLARRRPGTAAARTRPNTQRHARGSSGDGASETLLQEICGGTSGLVKRCATAHVSSVWTTLTWPGAPELRPGPGLRDIDLLTGRHHSTVASSGRRAWSRPGATSTETSCAEGEWCQG